MITCEVGDLYSERLESYDQYTHIFGNLASSHGFTHCIGFTAHKSIVNCVEANNNNLKGYDSIT